MNWELDLVADAIGRIHNIDMNDCFTESYYTMIAVRPDYGDNGRGGDFAKVDIERAQGAEHVPS